jgi:hypothetical protein
MVPTYRDGGKYYLFGGTKLLGMSFKFSAAIVNN